MIIQKSTLLACLAVITSLDGVVAADEWQLGRWGSPFQNYPDYLYAFSSDLNACDETLVHSNAYNGTRSQVLNGNGPEPFTLGGVEGLTIYFPPMGDIRILHGTDEWAVCEGTTLPPVQTTDCIYYPYRVCTQTNKGSGGGGGGGGGGSSSSSTHHTTTTHTHSISTSNSHSHSTTTSESHSHTTSSTVKSHSHTTSSTSKSSSHTTSSTSKSHSQTKSSTSKGHSQATSSTSKGHAQTTSSTLSTSVRTSTSSASSPQGTEATYHDQAQDVDDAHSASQEYKEHPHDQALAKKVSDAINKALDSAMKAASVAAPAAVTAAEAELVQDLTSAAKLAAAAAAADSIFSSILKVVAAHQAIEEARRSPSSTTGNHASPTPISSNSCKLGRALPLNRVGHNTLRTTECGANGQKTTTDYIITSITWPANPSTITVSATCSQKWAQACYHYSSVISNHTPWKTLTCPPEAATTSRRLDAVATRTWLGQHDGNQELVGNAGNWINKMYRPSTAADCARDEFPPAYFLTRNDPAFINSGRNTNGQMIRYLPGGQNTGAASMWNSICLQKPIDEITDDQVLFSKILRSPKSPGTSRLKTAEAFYVHIDVDHRPVFIITDWQQPVIAGDLDGLRSNPCWPQRLAPNDPGFALLTYDQWYTQHGRTPEYDYSSPYVRGQNGPANGP